MSVPSGHGRRAGAAGPVALLLLLLLVGVGARAEDGETVEAGPAGEAAHRLHLLRRSTFAPRREDVEEMERLGRAAWVDRQLQPALIPDREAEERLQGFRTLDLTTTGYWRLLDEGLPPAEVAGRGEDRNALARERQRRLGELRNLGRREVPAAVLLRAVYSRRQLQEVLLDFWRNHFNVDLNKDHVRYYVPDWEREVLRKHVLGRFEDLLAATARHPAMLFYLDNHVSQAPTARGERVLQGREREERTDGLNENYARELMELHTVGVEGGYDQDDVIQLALILTGWSIEMRGAERGAFVFREPYHARGRKRVLGKGVKAGGQDEGEAILEHLANHPNTREFVCRKLVRYLAADDPPPALVDAAVAAWKKSKGDLREVVRTILLHDAFYEAPCAFTKARTPFEFAVATLRATGADVSDARGVLARLADMSQPLYECEDPTGYSDVAADWMDPGVLATRWRFAWDVLHDRVPGVKLEGSPLLRHVRQNPEVWEPLLVDELFAGAGPASRTLAPLRRGVADLAPRFRSLSPDERIGAYRRFVTLLLGSPEFQRQ